METLEAANKTHKSIVFPAIGTGNLSFPCSVVAEMMFKCVFQFSRTVGILRLKDVHFVLYDRNTQTVRVSYHIIS